MNFETLSGIKEDLWTYLKKTEKKIVMYGTGNGADKILDVFEEKNIPLYGIFASDDFARDRSFRGHKVRKYSDFCSEQEDFLVVVSFASQREEVLENIYKINEERELYAPDVPVFGSGLFDLSYFKANEDRLKKVYDSLADDLSRKTFVMTLAFKLTGKIQYLRWCECSEEQEDQLLKDIVKATGYIDIGAYTGDTVEKYVELFGNDIDIYAFEPDEKNYRKMLERFDKKNISCRAFNNAAWNNNETLRFYSKSGRAGSADKVRGNVKYKEIEAVKVDDRINSSVGLIKIDAEGSDIKVLEGLQSTITTYTPCIKIAAYHRNEDYYSIPEALEKIKGGYRIYMRHLKYVPGWDTDFIFQYIKD